MADSFKTKLFRNESNKSLIEVLRDFLRNEGFSNFLLHRVPNNKPKSLEKTCMQTVNPRGFKRFHRLQGSPNFLIGRDVRQPSSLFKAKLSTPVRIPLMFDVTEVLLGLVKLLEA